MKPTSRTLYGNASRCVLLAVAFLGLLAVRRWPQVTAPQVWCEDGLILKGFADHGWTDFLQPLNGYLVLVPRLITWMSMAISVYYYPIVSTTLAWVFTVFVGLAVAWSPTRLRAKVACAVAVFLIPSDPEAFGLPLYTLWWSSLLLILLALWDERRPSLGVRLGYLLAGGLSSPFILVFVPVAWFRALWYRTRADAVVALGASAIAGLQLRFIMAEAAKAMPPLGSLLRHVIPKFCGWFLAGNLASSPVVLWSAGVAVIVLIAASLAAGRRDPLAWIMAVLYFGAIGSSVFRIDPSILHPVLAGPRYFFLPYVLAFWILIQLVAGARPAWLRACAAVAIILGIVNAFPVWTRRHDDLQWAEHVRSGRLFPVYGIPIEYDGHREDAWMIEEPGETWANLLRTDGLVTGTRLAELPTFAYRLVSEKEAEDAPKEAGASATAAGPSMVHRTDDRGRDQVRLEFADGRRVRFRSGPAKDGLRMRVVGRESDFLPCLPTTQGWVTLEFTNSNLPARFVVEVDDAGEGAGEWAAP
jgi:hypothetical protein